MTITDFEKDYLFSKLMKMNEELGHLNNDYIDNNLLDMYMIDELCRGESPLVILESVGKDFSPYDDYFYISHESGVYESLTERQAIEFMIDKKETIESEFLSNLDGQITHYWNVLLEDDDTDTGGVSFAGETLGDFLLEVYDYCRDEGRGVYNSQFMIELTLKDLNDVLKECGIKTLEEVEIKN